MSGPVRSPMGRALLLLAVAVALFVGALLYVATRAEPAFDCAVYPMDCAP